MADTAPISVLYCLFGAIALMTIIMLTAALRIVPEFRRLAVYRLGRYIGDKGPGLVILIPIIDRGIVIDTKDELAEAQAYQTLFGAVGKTQTLVHIDGKVEVEGKLWNATSAQSIPAGTRVRVKKVILEVESI